MKNLLVLMLCATTLFGQKNKIEKTFIDKAPYHIDTVSFKNDILLIGIREGVTYYYNNGSDSVIMLPMYCINTKTNEYKVAAISVVFYGKKFKAKSSDLTIMIDKCEKSGFSYGFDNKEKHVWYRPTMLKCEKLKTSTVIVYSFNEKYSSTDSFSFTKECVCGTSNIGIVIDKKEIVPFKERNLVDYFARVESSVFKN